MLTQEEQKVVDAIDTEEVTRLCVEAIRAPSYVPPFGNEQEIAELFQRELSGFGVDAQFQEVEPSRPNVIGTIAGEGQGRSILFNGHMDTIVPVMGWTRDPHAGVIEGDKIYGMGISNMKASCVAMVEAMGALKRSKVKLLGDVTAFLVMGECRGGEGAMYGVKHGVRADYFINGEPTDLNVLTLHSGVCQLKIIVRGMSHHFGIDGKGVNAIEKAIKIVQALGPTMTPMGEDSWLKKRKDSPAYEGLPKFNFGAIKGGLTEECSENGICNVPDYCVVSLDVRYTPGLTGELVKKDLEDAIADLNKDDPEIDARVELDYGFQMPPFEAQVNDYVVQTVRQAAVDTLGSEPPVGPLAPMKFMGADSGHIQAAGIPGVMFGVGNFTSSIPDEWVELPKVVDIAKIYALSAYRVANTPNGS